MEVSEANIKTADVLKILVRNGVISANDYFILLMGCSENSDPIDIDDYKSLMRSTSKYVSNNNEKEARVQKIVDNNTCRIEMLEQNRHLSAIIMASLKDGIGRVSNGVSAIWQGIKRKWAARTAVTATIVTLSILIMPILYVIVEREELLTIITPL